MRTEKAFVRALGLDSYSFSHDGTALQAKSFKAAKADFFVGYLGAMNTLRLNHLLEAGLAFMPVTFGMKKGVPLTSKLGASFGKTSASHAKGLGVLHKTTTFLDLEGCTGSAKDVWAFCDEWSKPILDAGLEAGLYVGAGAILSGEELYSLPGFTCYWQSLSRETDAKGLIAEPRCGWQMIQLYPSVSVGNVLVDWNVVQKDYKSRLPTWMVA